MRKKKIFFSSIVIIFSLLLLGVWTLFFTGKLSILADFVSAPTTTPTVNKNVIKTVSPTPAEVIKNGFNSPGPIKVNLDIKQAPAKVLSYYATIDGNADIQFSGSTATVLDADYDGVSNQVVSGDLGSCSKVALQNDITGRVSITENTDPFKVHVRDNGTGPAIYSFNLVCADDFVKAPSLHYEATIDGNANIQFSGSTATVLDADYDGVSNQMINGNLTDCKKVSLVNETTGRVWLTTFTDPFKIHVKDNGSGPADYAFDLVCDSYAVGIIEKFDDNYAYDPTGTIVQAGLAAIHYTATIDGNANIQFSGSTAKVLSADYGGVSNENISGDLTGCKNVMLKNEASRRVFATVLTDPFKIHVKDNGSGPADYSFDLVCTDLDSGPANFTDLTKVDSLSELNEATKYYVSNQNNELKIFVAPEALSLGGELKISFNLKANLTDKSTCIGKNSAVIWGQLSPNQNAMASNYQLAQESLPQYCYSLKTVPPNNPDNNINRGDAPVIRSLLQTGINIVFLLIITIALVAAIAYILALMKEK